MPSILRGTAWQKLTPVRMFGRTARPLAGFHRADKTTARFEDRGEMNPPGGQTLVPGTAPWHRNGSECKQAPARRGGYSVEAKSRPLQERRNRIQAADGSSS